MISVKIVLVMKSWKEHRENMKGNIVLAVEDISSRMFRLGKTLLFDKKVLTIDQILKKIDNITVNDINNIVEKYFNPENLRTIILGKNMEGIRNEKNSHVWNLRKNGKRHISRAYKRRRYRACSRF